MSSPYGNGPQPSEPHDPQQPQGQVNPQQGVPGATTPQPEKKKAGCGKIGCGVLAAILIVGGIATACGGGDDNKDKQETSQSTTDAGAANTDEGNADNTASEGEPAPNNEGQDQAENGQEQEADVPTDFKSALRQANTYASMMHMSQTGVYDQLVSEYGGQFSPEAAQYAIDNLNDVDWNDNALQKAKDYQDSMAMSPDAIYDQLVSDYGEKFTPEQAQYAVDNLN